MQPAPLPVFLISDTHKSHSIISFSFISDRTEAVRAFEWCQENGAANEFWPFCVQMGERLKSVRCLCVCDWARICIESISSLLWYYSHRYGCGVWRLQGRGSKLRFGDFLFDFRLVLVRLLFAFGSYTILFLIYVNVNEYDEFVESIIDYAVW